MAITIRKDSKYFIIKKITIHMYIINMLRNCKLPTSSIKATTCFVLSSFLYVLILFSASPTTSLILGTSLWPLTFLRGHSVVLSAKIFVFKRCS